jgi:ABC-type transport system involved in multi-copper enzyme maturation permease subunit
MKSDGESPLVSWSNRASVQIFRSVRDLLLSKWILVAFPIILIPSFIAFYTIVDPPEGVKDWPEAFVTFAVFINMQILVLMFSLIYGTSIMNEEMESRTVTYLFLRGSKRFEVLLYKFAGVYISLSIMFTISTVLTYFIFSMHTSVEVLRDHIMVVTALLGAQYFGLFAYLSLFSLMGVVFKRPLVVGLIFSFFWEFFMVNIELNVAQVTIMYYIRSIFLGTEAVRQYTDFDDKASVAGSMIGLVFLGFSFLIVSGLALSRKDVH